MDADLDLLLTTVLVAADDLLPARRPNAWIITRMAVGAERR
jgi:hypothetical protein